jgi:hypothetical protein
MQRSLFVLAIALPFSAAACLDTDEPVDQDEVLPSTRLATFQLDNGNRVEFELTADGGVAVGEIADGKSGHAQLVLDPEGRLDPLERFLAIAPEGTPVPDALAALDDGRGLVGDRATVPVLDATIDASVAIAFSPWDVDTNGACDNADQFYNDVCLQADTEINQFWFCDWNYNGGNSMWFHLLRSTKGPRWDSPQDKRRSVTWTLSCDTNVTVQHRAWLDGDWATILDKDQGDYVISSWTQLGSDRHRGVKIDRTQSQSGFRSLAYFTEH